MYNLKRRVYEIIEDDIKNSWAHRIVEAFIVSLIILNVVAIIAESFVSKDNIFWVSLLYNFEVFSVAVFSVEYILRLWVAEIKYPGYPKYKAVLKFVFSVEGIIDLLSILPFYVSLCIPKTFDGRIIRALRLFRLLRILKLNRFLDPFRMITKVIKSRKYELLITFFIAFMFIIIASTIMYELEKDAQPDKFPNILAAFWWSVATLTTIGYGDVYPITSLGKCMSTFISLVGIGLIALPTGILSSGFLEEYRISRESMKNEENNSEEICPYCGQKISEHHLKR